ncbi:MAG: hypothetical protein ACTH2Q_09015 [Propionibacteriaceae bacterium]
MSSGQIEELTVPYDGTEVQRRLQHRKGMLRMRLISLAVTLVIMVVVYIFFRERFEGAGPSWIIVYGLVLLLSVGWVAGTFVAYRLAKQEADGLPPDGAIALRVNRQGVEVAGTAAGWHEVQTIAVVKGKFGQGQLLQVARTTGDPVWVSIRQLPVPLGTVDSVARAYSAGRHGVDLTALDA